MVRSLRVRLMLSYFITIFVAIILAGSLVLAHMRITLEEEKTAATLMSANVAANAGAGLFSPELHNELRQASREMTASLGTRVLYIDSGARVLADGYGELEGHRIAHEAAVTALAGESMTDVVLSGGGSVMYAAVPIFGAGRVIGAVFLSADMEPVVDGIRSTRVLLFSGATLGAAVAGFLAYVFASTLTGPLRQLARAANRLAQGRLDWNAELPHSSDEVGDVGRAFRHLLDSLEREDSMRRMFVDNASHEIRSPLASLRALAQGLMDDPNPDLGLQREFLQQMDLEIDRLGGLASNLTELSASQVLRRGFARREVAIDGLVRALLARMEADGQLEDVIVQVSGSALWPVEPHWLEVALENMVGNAVKYAASPQGSVRVDIATLERELLLVVEDDGPGIPSEDRSRVFERFYRVDRARDRRTGGSGLGLSIVRQIVEAHGGDIRVTDSVLGGARFETRIPVEH